MIVHLANAAVADLRGQFNGENKQRDDAADIDEDLNNAEELRLQIKINSAMLINAVAKYTAL